MDPFHSFKLKLVCIYAPKLPSGHISRLTNDMVLNYVPSTLCVVQNTTATAQMQFPKHKI